jgi:hypothetical protein
MLARERIHITGFGPELLIFPRLVEIIVRLPERTRGKLLAEAETAKHYRVIRSSAQLES